MPISWKIMTRSGMYRVEELSTKNPSAHSVYRKYKKQRRVKHTWNHLYSDRSDAYLFSNSCSYPASFQGLTFVFRAMKFFRCIQYDHAYYISQNKLFSLIGTHWKFSLPSLPEVKSCTQMQQSMNHCYNSDLLAPLWFS